MKKILGILLIIAVFPSLLMAGITEENRRIEEKKRKSLRPTEGRVIKEKKRVTPSLDPVDLVYLAGLMSKKVAYRYDAYKALTILMRVEDQYFDLGSQVVFLKNKNILPKNLKAELDTTIPLRKGLTAYMFLKALDIKGGVLLRLFGINERYALKELVYQGMMSSGNVKDIVDGDELVSILFQANSYMEKKGEKNGDKTKGVR